ncbi:MAG: type II toxin-antitoxin system MqsA family antitoxin [Dehalococcoidia bacterium]
MDTTMNCSICRTGKTKPGKATVTLERGATTVVIKGVPAEICDNCDEYYLSEKVARDVYARTDAAARNAVEVEILRYAA